MEDGQRSGVAAAVETETADVAETAQAQTATPAATASRVGFLITAVDAETRVVEESPSSAALLPELVSEAKVEEKKADGADLALKSVYKVEDAELPLEAIGNKSQCAPLPPTIPMERVLTNIVQNLDFKAWSEKARNAWFRDFKSAPSRAVIGDAFWYCICWYFKPGQHTDLETLLFDRISANFVALFCSVSSKRKDFFFRCYADAVAQAVLYAMFLAYPKSRVHFTQQFRRDLIIRISYWTTGVCPEFVDASHWKLNLGGGDVLQASTAAAQPMKGGGRASAPALLQAGDTMSDWDAKGVGHRLSIAQRAPRPMRRLGYSPLVAHFLKSRKYSSLNLVPGFKVCMTTAEERFKLMDVKHAMLQDRATAARESCEAVMADYEQLVSESRYQERQKHLHTQAAKNRLELRRKEVLRSDPHEFANYLVSLHVIQQGGIGQVA
mmetsp:Transcript_6791/g.11938  ORF Transcript_6791/g.11938 Transcript_6791/m.11938 type:complete len:440 (+) Transcript_6791:61-1380(+)